MEGRCERWRLTSPNKETSALGAETWLRSELPVEWIMAIDNGDSASLAQARKTVDVEEWWRRFGKTGYFVPTWPQEHGGHNTTSKRRGRCAKCSIATEVPGH